MRGHWIQSLLAITAISAVTSSPALANKDKDSPCYPLMSACEKAGFAKGENAPDGKDLKDDCKEPLLKGKNVTGVKVDQKDVNLCKQYKEDHKEWTKQWKKSHSS